MVDDFTKDVPKEQEKESDSQVSRTNETFSFYGRHFRVE